HSMATALEAQDAVNIAMNDIVDALEDLGLTEDDIETSSITLSEQWSWRDDEYETTGWRASQTLTITTTDISMAGEIIDVSVENGANDINGVTFSLSDESEKAYRILALEQVGELAKEKAEAICEGLGVNLGGIKSVSESGVYYVSYDAEEYDLKNDASSVTPTVVISGSVSVTASIYVVYYID
nr:SIMPL domain-containing protein [Candidatus Methanofastidiosa archaeon]